MPSTITLDANGYFVRKGRRVTPVGVNYWPASCGVEMWQDWPAAEIQHDLDVVASMGLNCVRFFLRWQDFEPEAGRYDERMFSRLRQILTWCRERALLAHPSLFVGWMSGGVFWPGWKAGRNVFADSYMVERAAAFAHAAAAVIEPFHPHVLAIDQGNELCCLAESSAAPPQAVMEWCRQVNEAICAVYPEALIVSGNEQNQIDNDTGWRLGQQPGVDFYSMHGYPVPAWHSIAFDGMTDPLCQSLLPFYVQVARSFGPVLVQEFGTIVTFGAEQQDAYLRAVLPACWEAGCNGFLWWCLRDIKARVHPYLKNSFEGTLGLVGDDDHVKPGLGYFIEFARSLQQRPAPDRTADIGLYWPKHYYLRDNQHNPGNNPRSLARRLIMANYILRQLGHHTRIVRGDLALDSSLNTMLIPGALLGGDETAALDAWVRSGRRLIWHGPDPFNWGADCIRLLGARPVDYRSTQAQQIAYAGEVWTLGGYPRNMRVELAPTTAQVLARTEDGLPSVLVNRVGDGTVVYALPLLEDAMADVSCDHTSRSRWLTWYRRMLEHPAV
jgi:hypothetical protein